MKFATARARARMAELEQTLHALGSGEVDSFVVAGKGGNRVFTLEGAEHAYRVLIESMNEGALKLTTDAVILYANESFARMVELPLEKVIGTSFRRFLRADDRKTLRPLLLRSGSSGTKILVSLNGGASPKKPVQISVRTLQKNGSDRRTIAMVVTDLSESARVELLLRALSNRVVRVQEEERGRVALELHDKITQHLAAAVFRSQALVDLLTGEPQSKATKLRRMLGSISTEVQNISRNLRPSVLDQLGLVAILHDASKDFTDRTGVPVKFACIRLSPRLPPDIELALYRILQESLKNVEKHARARQVSVSLRTRGDFIVLEIKDNGVGFDQAHSSRRKEINRLGLLGMSERATFVGGAMKIISNRRTGTEIAVSIPRALAPVGRS